MKAASFTYHRPDSIAAALALLARYAPEDGRIISGGQSLVPIMAFRLSRPAHLIDISHVAGLDILAVDSGHLRIGARVRHAAFEAGLAPGPLGALLTQVTHAIAHAPIRTRGTFCGSVAHADPASEWCLLAATLDAQMIAARADGERMIAACDFFAGVMSTALAPDELLREVRLPLLPDDARWGFAEFSRRAGDFAMAASIAVVQISDGKLTSARVGIGGAEAHPRRLPGAEAALLDQPPSSTTIAAAAAAAAAEIDPLEDSQTDAVYRRELTEAMVRRALTQAIEGAA